MLSCLSISYIQAQNQPEFFGRYILQNDSLIEVPTFDLKLVDIKNGDLSIPGFSTLPKNVIELKSITPTFIYYDQTVTTNTVRLSNLFMIPLSDGSLAYAPVGNVALKIKPLDKQGMFFFKPEQKLETGYYAIYGGNVLGYNGATTGNVAIIKVTHPLESEILSTIENFIQAVDSKNYSVAAKFSYAEVEKKSVGNTEEDAKKLKRSKVFASKIIPTSILEETGSEGEIYYKVNVALVGALISIRVGNFTLGDATGTFMFVSKIDGNLRVWTKPNENVFIFRIKK